VLYFETLGGASVLACHRRYALMRQDRLVRSLAVARTRTKENNSLSPPKRGEGWGEGI
jgi:hypothetical protein